MTKTALLSIDVQQGFKDASWGSRNNPDAEQNIALLMSECRQQNIPVIHIKHCSTEANSTLNPNHPGNAYQPEGTPLNGEKQFDKCVNSAFIGTGLEAYLHEHDINTLIIVGLTTDHCVSTSTRMAGNLGFTVTLVSDATATFDRTGHDDVHYSAEQIHHIHLASLNGEFCTVQSTEQVLAAIST